jgi:glycosyltransferase involved in cell wall biosynthesis
MKILITNHWLKKLGGSETFTYTLAGALVKAGHKVELFTNVHGLVSNRIANDFNIPWVPDPQTRHYDLILANHNTCVKQVARNEAKIIQTCHGTTPKLEQPSTLANEHVSISTEVAEHLTKLGFHSHVIRNGIDCDRFKPTSAINTRLKTVLSLSHSEELNNILKPMFEKHGIKFESLNKFKNPVWNVENYINSADLVITLGRGAYEAMACGRPVLVLDKRSRYQSLLGDGLLTPDTIDRSSFNNCSGRAFRRKDVHTMIDEVFVQYNSEMQSWCRGYALKKLNMSVQVNKYLDLV